VGGNNPVTVQTMYDKPLSLLEENFASRMSVLQAMGCDIIRFSYPDIKEHNALCSVVEKTSMPVVADIHFDYRNALDCMDCKVAGLRINPGNIGARWKTEEIVRKALDKGVVIRIGLNSGSLPENTKGKDAEILMADTALEYIGWFENLGFTNTCVSLKASDPQSTYRSYRYFASYSDYPLHLGVTEAGTEVTSCVRTTWALGKLLEEGIGSTIRYSITGSIENEVIAGVELLRTLGLRKKGLRLISCPMCGRKVFDTQKFIEDVKDELFASSKDICVAVMGCQVNGPGEAKGADIAVSGVGNKVVLYRKGVIFKEINACEAKEELLKLIEQY